ncbi:autotransporter assembly complex family protein [Oceanimonas sp. CHS3-5]|uniref:autotransporter assembly complex protein TamA n=1 Tax=Oceanimonas sp. CHS3-5 TaxID=3068186 RepID=UPI00273E0EE2|nr:autotransporter assembly complex family protein [Oceanimonas sp. CHS3-5]MDP5291343.1 autotransporter assembly complex family protein [Oceanimonas sp. CHS3-5]
MSVTKWGLMALMLISLGTRAEDLDLRLSGLDDELEDNTQVYLDQLPAIEVEQFSRFKRQITTAVTDSLQSLGYYNPEIELIQSEQNPARVTVRVNAGEPVRIRTLNVRLEGDAETDTAFADLLGNFAIRQGEVLHHNQYETAKASLLSLALRRGYFDAAYRTSRVRVMPWEKAADVDLSFDSGPRYRFGELMVDSDRPVDRLLEPLVDIKPGEPYHASRLAELSRSLSSTRYFKQVEVLPRVVDADEQQRVPLSVVLRARADNEVEVGVGVSTDEGPRVSVNWEKPWINSLGHSLTTSLKVSAPSQDVTLVYKIPRGHPLEDYYTIQGGYQRLDQDDTVSDRLVAGVHRWNIQENGWTRDVFLRSEYESYTQGEQEDTSFLLIPGATFSRTRVRGGLDPYWGDAQTATLELSEPWWGSDTRFVRFWGRSKWLRTLAEDHRLLARAEQGAVWVEEVEDLPPSLRFFTGGDTTVRGYSYQSITPLDENGDRLGAKYATALSLEYDYRFAPKWRVATFVDSGTATNDYQDDWKVGTGLGLRWLTPVGPVRLDLAFAVSEEDTPWRLHFTLGPEL